MIPIILITWRRPWMRHPTRLRMILSAFWNVVVHFLFMHLCVITVSMLNTLDL